MDSYTPRCQELKWCVFSQLTSGEFMAKRNKSRDGLKNRVEYFVLTHFRPVWDFIYNHPRLNRAAKKFMLNKKLYTIPSRPYPYSTWGAYTSWESLTDKSYNSRFLPPAEKFNQQLPPIGEVAKLFIRPAGSVKYSYRTSLLLPVFASWFIDSFFRTDRSNNLKNHSTHQLDLSQLYGFNRKANELLRTMQGGKLKSQFINGEEYPPYCYEQGERKPEFKDLTLALPWYDINSDKKNELFATTERGNIQTGYMMFNVLFMREHNRICGLLAQQYPDWDDERLFQTARNICIVLMLKIVIEEYVHHLAPYCFKFTISAEPFYHEKWYRQNWMTAEFNLLYRWHSMMPDKIIMGGQKIASEETAYNNRLITDLGLGALFESHSLQPASKIALFNTPSFLFPLEEASIKMARDSQLASYNDYREFFDLPRITDFQQITGDDAVIAALKRVYDHPDNMELFVGLFAEEPWSSTSVLPYLMGRIVVIDAVQNIFTNPLLSENVFNADTFSPLGMEIIAQTHSISDIVHRNIPQKNKEFFISFSVPDKLLHN